MLNKKIFLYSLLTTMFIFTEHHCISDSKIIAEFKNRHEQIISGTENRINKIKNLQILLSDIQQETPSFLSHSAPLSFGILTIGGIMLYLEKCNLEYHLFKNSLNTTIIDNIIEQTNAKIRNNMINFGSYFISTLIGMGCFSTIVNLCIKRDSLLQLAQIIKEEIDKLSQK